LSCFYGKNKIGEKAGRNMLIIYPHRKPFFVFFLGFFIRSEAQLGEEIEASHPGHLLQHSLANNLNFQSRRRRRKQ